MKLRQREKIVKAWYSGKRLRWRRSTRLKAFNYFRQGADGGFLIPKYLQAATERFFARSGSEL